ncbi:MAG TPA: hypothetical protein VF430_04755 [Verrucomicrobiae bacterium]
MDTDERDIFQFLKTWGVEFTNAKEVARRAASKKRFYDDPEWAKPILMRMADRGILESDVQGRYRIKPVSRKKKGNQWVAPDIAKILKESGVEVEAAGEGDIAEDEYYEQL